MNVKRVSYFSFLIAITTIATVSSCHQIKQKNNTALTPIDYVTIAGMASVCEDLSLDCWVALVKALEENGVQPGKFRITQRKSGTENTVNIYLVFDKDYKGPVSARIFDLGDLAGDPKLLAFHETDRQQLYSSCPSDKREHIAHKNLILRE